MAPDRRVTADNGRLSAAVARHARLLRQWPSRANRRPLRAPHVAIPSVSISGSTSRACSRRAPRRQRACKVEQGHRQRQRRQAAPRGPRRRRARDPSPARAQADWSRCSALADTAHRQGRGARCSTRTGRPRRRAEEIEMRRLERIYRARPRPHDGPIADAQRAVRRRKCDDVDFGCRRLDLGSRGRAAAKITSVPLRAIVLVAASRSCSSSCRPRRLPGRLAVVRRSRLPAGLFHRAHARAAIAWRRGLRHRVRLARAHLRASRSTRASGAPVVVHDPRRLHRRRCRRAIRCGRWRCCGRGDRRAAWSRRSRRASG